MPLGFAKGHHIIQHRRKSGPDFGLEELPKILGFPCATAEANNFKFGKQLWLNKPTIISHPEEKWCGLGLGKHPNIWGSL